jgi:hypothetical protein
MGKIKIQVSARKSAEKRKLERPRRRWENIRMDLK